jgi:hypothetical protein
MFMTIVITGGICVIKIEAEKFLKYVDLAIEVQRMWKLEAKLHL